MGSPLGPTLANFFLAKRAKRIMSITSSNHPLLHLRYVDDIFAVFETNESCLKFLDTGILNSQHKNIKFTVEYGSELMCFLDVEIKVKGNGCDTWTWRKTTHTGLLQHFDALCPLKWKSGVILCLLNRAKAICSFKFLSQNDVIKLRQVFFSNGYPIWFFNKFLQRFLTVDNDLSDRERSEINSVVYLNVPYIGKESRCFVSRLAKFSKMLNLMSRCLPFQNLQNGDIFSAKVAHFSLALLKCRLQIYMFV